ncbi:MAG: hypothetical protein U0491_02410 [Candidatus Saccharimonadales bacterium]
MAKVNQIDKEVSVTAVYFGNGAQFKTFPRQIELEGTTYTFSEGLQLLVQKGQELVKIFDMTDGTARYRLRNDVSERTWRLMSITQN